MPKDTFFNLSKEKQHTLIASAKNEFSRVPFHQACISNIVKSAHIPRGSFYQYFEDKEDLYLFLLSEHSKRTNQKFITILEENNGSLLDSMVCFFQFLLENTQEQEERDFFKHTYLNLNYKSELTLTTLSMEEHDQQYSKLVERINKQELVFHQQEELDQVIKMIRALLFQSLMEHFAKPLSTEKSIQQFRTQIEILKNGIYKRNLLS